MIDGYLQLYDAENKLVEGECQDAAFRRAIEIYDFSMGGAGSDRAKSKKAAQKDFDNIDDRVKQLKATLAKLAGDRNFEPSFVEGQAKSAIADTDRIRAYLDNVRAALLKGEEPPEPPPTPEGGAGVQKTLKFDCTKWADSASADLFQAFCRQCVTKLDADHTGYKLGEYKKAVVTLRKMFDNVALPYLQVTFKDVLLDDYSLKYDEGEGNLVEDVAFTFVEFDVEYFEQLPDGKRAKAVVASGSAGNTKAGGGGK